MKKYKHNKLGNIYDIELYPNKYSLNIYYYVYKNGECLCIIDENDLNQFFELVQDRRKRIIEEIL